LTALTSARAVDVALMLFIASVAEVSAWSSGFLGEHVAGPRVLTALLPLGLAVPMLWRRSHPLAMWCVVAAAVAAQALVSGDSAEGLEIVAALIAGPYAVAAYGARRQAVTGLGVLVIAYGIYAWNDHNFRSGRSSEKWATAFFALAALAAWLIGATIQARREHAAAAERARVLDEQSRAALAAERSRVARELHDIVSHNLSVVVLQAAGARAAGEQANFDASDTLERIEESGREALLEMRRMLGVLRTDGADAELVPQPGITDIAALVDSVRRSGLSIELACEPGPALVPPAIGLSAYRIVQESLTNVLKHAGSCTVTVALHVVGSDLVVCVRDDGTGNHSERGELTGGHGLSGMRERVSLLGGELRAGPCPGGGFEVHARLPLHRTMT
jgi:signal transduction histidine kinase